MLLHCFSKQHEGNATTNNRLHEYVNSICKILNVDVYQSKLKSLANRDSKNNNKDLTHSVGLIGQVIWIVSVIMLYQQ